LLGYLVRDVIGAHQEESFGIRQNHTMSIQHWDALVKKYFADHEYDAFVPERGWGESLMKRALMRADRKGSDWLAARWLGGTLAAVCKKAGAAPAPRPFTDFETFLRCPDCHAPLTRDSNDVLRCACGYQAPNEGQVYNLLPSAERKELYPGDREDIIDFSLPGHEKHLLGDWYHLEGVYGNKYRWIADRAVARLTRVKPGPQKLRIRGHASAQGIPGEVRAVVNGAPVGTWKLDRPGLFVLEADLPAVPDNAPEYKVEILASPVWTVPTDDRRFSVSLSMIRLVEK